MEIKIKSYSSQSSLISSILFFILGAILFTSADRVITTVSKLIGIVLMAAGIISLVIFYFQSRKANGKKGNLAFGIVTLVLSIIFLFFSNVVEQFIRFIVGAWILFTGIIRLINVLSMSKKNTKFIQLLIVAILLILVGVYTIVIGDVLLTTIGLIMMIYAAIEIAGYIFYSKDKVDKEEEEGTTTLLIPEDNEEENKKRDKKEKKDTKLIKDVEENEENEK